ncbi:WD repeat-containing protein 5-like protein [Camponotus japonicus]
MDSIELKDQQRYGRGYFDKYNNEEDRKSEESQKNADILRDMELQKRHEILFPENLQGLFTARFSKTGKFIATGFGNGAIQIRNGKTGELTASLKSGLEISMPVMCCRFNPVHKDIFYASSACGNIFMCNTHTKEFSRFIFELKNEINTIDVSITGDYLVSGGKDATVRLYDTRNTKLILEYKKNEEDLIESKATNFHRMRIFASRFHNEYSDLIITGGWDDTVRIWDIRVSTGSIRVIKGPHICGDAIDICETRILTGSWIVRDSLQIWDLMSAKLIETINPQNRLSTLNGEFLYAVQYLDGDPYGDLILTGGSGTGALEVISLREKKVMGSISVNKPIFTIDSHQNIIIFGGIESVLRLGDYY